MHNLKDLINQYFKPDILLDSFNPSANKLTVANAFIPNLDVTNIDASGYIEPSVGNSSSNGIMFPTDPGGGSGDAAYIRYYAQSGEDMRFEIGTTNDSNDDLYLNASGGVRIEGGIKDSGGSKGSANEVLVSTGSQIDWQPSIKGFISFTGAGNVARSHNLSVSRTGTGQYTVTLASGIRNDTNYGVVITNVSDKRWVSNYNGDIPGYQPQDYNCWLESRSTNSFTLRARQFTDGGKHRQGHDDEWYEYVFHRVAVDPDYISLIVF